MPRRRRPAPSEAEAALDLYQQWQRLKKLLRKGLRTLKAEHPNATCITINPCGVPGAWPMDLVLRHYGAARRGKPVDHEVDFHDGSTPTIIKLPLLFREPKISNRPAGRPRKLTLAVLEAHVKQYPGRSDRIRAKLLSRQLYGDDKSISPTTVREARHELKTENRR